MTTQTQGKNTGFQQALLVQMRVIGALILREMRVRHGHSQIGYVWAVAEPIAYIAAMSAIFSYIERPPPYGTSMALFFALGIIPFKMFTSVANQLTAAMQANQALLAYPIVRELDTIFARFILEAATSVTIFIVCLFGLSFVDDIGSPSHPLRIVEGISLLLLFALGLGLTNACIMRFVGSWQNIYRMIMAPMIFLSCIFYSLASLPSEARAILVWNPLVHGIETIRSGYYSHYRAPGLDETYLFSCGLALVVIGLFLERFYRVR